MAETVYEDSAFRFTDPIRVFKANDPYYFEVDNIPLAQLQENCLWLKDQLTTKVQEKLQNIKRSDIDELKPYSTGGDRKVRVKPGRYTARVNDVASKKPLQYLEQVLGLAGSVGQVDGWAAATDDPNGLFPAGVSPSYNALLSTALANFKGTTIQNALHMNGLAERAFTWPVRNADTPVDGTGVTLVPNSLQYFGPSIKVPLLAQQALLWVKTNPGANTSFSVGTYDIGNSNIGFGLLPKTESQWVKKWRGVARTAIVDIPNELSIDIPAYDANDFYYTDAQGNKVIVGAQNRIDMVFIYSKPVDASSTSTLKNLTSDADGNAQPTVITKAELGVVRGAGIGPSFQEQPSSWLYNPVKSVDAQGNQMIVPSVGDQWQDATQYGFLAASGNDISQNIVGSFPAPDDIMNIAPLLSEKLESDAVELIGQSILPIAYVFVSNPGSEGVTQVVLNSDIIDIRPFFRTTELAYNERAGIAGAMPQLSLANPAVGKAELDTKVWELKKYIDGLHAVETVHSQDNISTLAAGYVFGGTTFGPEAALADFYSTNMFSGDYGKAIKYVAGKYGFGNQNAADTATGPTAFNLPALPQWDVAKWAINYQDSGKAANDYITIFANQSTVNNFTSQQQVNDGKEYSIVAGSKRNKTTEGSLGGGGTRLTQFLNQVVGHSQYQGGDGNLNNFITFGVISKRIYFERGSVSWLADYLVDIQFINCLPQTYFGSGNNDSPRDRKATYTGWWVEKGWDYFTIYISVAAPASWTESLLPVYHGNAFPYQNRDDSAKWSNFIVMADDIMAHDNGFTSHGPDPHTWSYNGNPRAGLCTVPTVMWKVTGIPMNDNANFYPNLDTRDPIIQFKNS
jgi:hypothetical protein